ncbi:MAG TPA: biotin--[acetyl-CoA-carboxylase] ligase [Candidatus Blautia pullicola]|jgi:BirA family biotin operon repressor/biotin-[acetyl-CoA-carboxylase] ligase|uniref:Bifunctional ligase/repressor BirA n=1 Tax=Candidatus Blautia pullicola TaxID=2838498 RepID=A0A9D2FUA9_9FIRM|nr:biotin--[acetyl-CoA-carboxylase] ligase [Candidatus Blautia pullicola]
MSTKERLLSILEENKGEYLSGEEIASRLELSRAAVWKGIQALRREGHQISAVTNKGYALNLDSDVLSKQGILTWLKEKNGWVEVRQEMVSTNEWLKQEALAKKLPHGSLAAAQYQSGGKGRRGRSFYSPKDSGLYLSVLLHPKKTAQESLEITAAAAVAVCKAVEQVCGVSLGIKWVNDLYLEEKKVCGILTEAVTDFETGDIEFVVVGIGLNLYPPEGGFPKYLEHVAGTILEPGQGADRNRLAGEIVNRLLEEVEKPGIPPEYIKRNIVPGKQVKISYGSQERVVIAKKIRRDGQLEILNEKGEREVLPCGDVSLFLS